MGTSSKDALVYREVSATIWDIRRIDMARLPAFQEAGWIVLITEASLRDLDPPPAARPRQPWVRRRP